MVKFIFFGRLVSEKWVDLILDVFEQLHTEGVDDRQLDLYGVWPLTDACLNLEKKLPKQVLFHGRSEGEDRRKIFQQYDFCLMPSLLIESFWLTALESIRAWTPLIGFKKWGVTPFVTDQLNIENQPGETYGQKLFNLIKELLSFPKEKSSYLPDIDLADYSPQTRLSRFTHIAGDARRVLLVSDFTKRIGWIENYIHDVKELLQTHGYTVEIRWINKGNDFWGLLKTAFNISAWRKLRKKIREFRPDLIRCHSVIRELGRVPLLAIPKNTKILMMFHDVGYFHPYSSEVFSLSNLPKDASLRERILAGKRKSPQGKILLALKWVSLRVVKGVFYSRSTTYLVPSDFMKPFSDKRRAKERQETIVLPHFVK